MKLHKHILLSFIEIKPETQLQHRVCWLLNFLGAPINTETKSMTNNEEQFLFYIIALYSDNIRISRPTYSEKKAKVIKEMVSSQKTLIFGSIIKKKH